MFGMSRKDLLGTLEVRCIVRVGWAPQINRRLSVVLAHRDPAAATTAGIQDVGENKSYVRNPQLVRRRGRELVLGQGSSHHSVRSPAFECSFFSCHAVQYGFSHETDCLATAGFPAGTIHWGMHLVNTVIQIVFFING